MRVACYNIHGWRGLFGRSPERILSVIRELEADVVVLNEVDHPVAGSENGEALLERETGMHVIHGPTMASRDTRFGNVLLTRHPPTAVRRHQIGISGREPRGLLDVEFERKGKLVRVLGTHLGLKRWERRMQAEMILNVLHEHHAAVTLLVGDLNEWMPAGGTIRALQRAFSVAPVGRSFPSPLPLLPLDRIMIRPSVRLADFFVHKSLTARLASDHLPVVADIRD